MAEISPILPLPLTAALTGRYAIEREVGAGGMATVYLAHDLRHERHVALKILRPELAAVLGAERFLAEIRTTANLQHPGILPLFDSGEAGGHLFYVMPFVEGESLRDRLDREGQLAVADAVRIAAEVGDAIAYAQERGVIHRDIKPENILLQSGHALVADFGIALAVREAGGVRITQTGLSLGTPAYMSPEQAAADRAVDGRTDQYSLGAVLYEMLAGEPPFSAPSTPALIARVMSEAPRPITTARPLVPGHVAAAVHQALEKIPADRFAGMREFVRALTSPDTAARAVGTAAPRWSRRALLPALAAATLAGAALGALVMSVARRGVAEPPALPTRFVIESDTTQRLNLVCCGQFFALTRDGRRLAFQGTASDSVTRIHLRDLGSLGMRSLPGTDDARELFFSPDGNHVGFSSRRVLRTFDLTTGVVTTVVAKGPGYEGGSTWTDDGRILFTVGRTLYQVPERGGTATVLYTPADSTVTQIGNPHFIPGTRTVLFTNTSATAVSENTVGMLWLDKGGARVVAPGVGGSFIRGSGATGWLLSVRSSGTLEARPFNPATGDTLGAAIRVSESVLLRSPVFLYAEYAASASGTVVTVTRATAGLTGRDAVRFETADTAFSREMPFPAYHLDQVTWSADGRRLLVAAYLVDVRQHALYAYDWERRTATRVTRGADVMHGGWIPGSDSILLYSDGQMRVKRIDTDTAARALGALVGAGSDSHVDARWPWVAYEILQPGRADIAAVHVDSMDRPKVMATQFEERRPAISPDHRFIAYTSNATGRTQVYVATFPVMASGVVVSDGIGSAPRWASRGELHYLGPRGEVMAVAMQPGSQPVPGTPRVLSGPRLQPRYWDVDPGGKAFVFTLFATGLGQPRLVVTLNALGAVIPDVH